MMSPREFNLFYDQYGSFVWGQARWFGRCHADAEDIAQETWLSLWQAPELLARVEADRERAWLREVVKRQTARYYRDKGRHLRRGKRGWV